jgi:drug/metabolite transporter (DMT)-like permease
VSARAWGLFAAVSLIWGVPYLFIKLAIEGGMPAVSIALARVVLGAVVLLVVAVRAGTLASLRGHWRWLAAFAVVEIAIPFPMISVGETRIDSSTTAILIATAPLAATFLAVRLEPDDRLTRARLGGLLVGLGGVAALVGVHIEAGGGALLGVGAVLLAASCYSLGATIIKHRLSDLDPIASMGASLTIAAVLLTVPAVLGYSGARPSAGALASVVVLGLFCTAAALVLMVMLVDEVGPARALVVTYVNPVIAVALGVVFLGESPGPGAIAGLALILAGSWLATGGALPVPGGLRRSQKSS